jgi:hypothetical protein
MKKTLVSIIGLCISLSLLAAVVNQQNVRNAATTTVYGQVIDQLTGEPLAGACITPAGSSQAVYTDFDGNFSIEQPAGSTLSVSLISYQARQVQPNGSSLVVELMQ